jgi:hypothetical protein
LERGAAPPHGNVRDGWKAGSQLEKDRAMEARTGDTFWRRLKWSWKIARAGLLEHKGQFARALALLDDAERVRALPPSGRVRRARLLLRSERVPEASAAFLALRNEFRGSDNPDRQYLRHYCTYMLSKIGPTSSGQWSYEAAQAKPIACRPWLKSAFPMTTTDEIHDRIRPRD